MQWQAIILNKQYLPSFPACLCWTERNHILCSWLPWQTVKRSFVDGGKGSLIPISLFSTLCPSFCSIYWVCSMHCPMSIYPVVPKYMKVPGGGGQELCQVNEWMSLTHHSIALWLWECMFPVFWGLRFPQRANTRLHKGPCGLSLLDLKPWKRETLPFPIILLSTGAGPL